MRRILFVDDEQQLLDALRNLLRRQRKLWEMTFALGAEAALEELKKAPFDVVVSDMRMPGMDGSALLERVRALYPAAARIVLSGHAEREAVVRALAVAHQFLSKPCDGETLRTAIEHACALQQLVTTDAVRGIVGSVERLPSIPRTYAELRVAFGRPETGKREIAAIVERDSAMSMKVLQLVNAAYFGLGQRMTSIEQAVIYLGADLLKGLALSAQIFSALEAAPVEGFSVERLQHHALSAAVLARRFFKDPQKAQEAFTAALLHDIGRVVAALGMPGPYAEVIRIAQESHRPLHEVEREKLGVTHAELGAHLLGVWGLPFSVVEAVAFHHDIGGAAAGALEIIAAAHVADALVDSGGPNPKLDPAMLARAGLAAELPRWQQLATSALSEPTRAV